MSNKSKNKTAAAQSKRPPFRPIKLVPTAELNNLPGFKEAVELERRNRLLAFANVSQTVCGGFELMPLTLERYNILRISGSPFLNMEMPKPHELAMFLWAMSPQYRYRKISFVRAMFFRRCRSVFMPVPRGFFELVEIYAQREAQKILNFNKIVEAIVSTFGQVFQDAPKASKGEGKSYYDLSVSFVGTIARNYGWSEEKVLRTPLARLLQYRRECLEHEYFEVALHTGGRFVSPLDNPSDAIKMKFSIEYGKKVTSSAAN